jgi:hypothetical protein
MPRSLRSVPLGPSARVREILLVKGGEINGSNVTIEISTFIAFGTVVLVMIRANKYPMKVPLTETAIANIRESNKALSVYRSPRLLLICWKEK